MISSGDVEYQPNVTDETMRAGVPLKAYRLTSSILMLTAGDAADNSEIFQRLFHIIGARIVQEPHNWWNVGDVAQLYVESYDQIRARRAASAALRPLGLNPNSFIERQSEMADSFIKRISDDLTTYTMPKVEAIICGIDRTGCHLYRINNFTDLGDCIASCEDTIGFAAIGSGAHHAESQLMAAGHHRASAIPETIFLIYLAKKRAEIAPGVGPDTDMWTMGPQLGSLQPMLRDVINNLDGIYERHLDAERAAMTAARQQAEEYVSSLTAAQTTQNQSAPEPRTESTPPADDETSAPNASSETT
jgi:hypothetical protein